MQSKKSKTKKISVGDVSRLKYINGIQKIMSLLGFSHFESDGKQIIFDGRTGELDDIFINENIIVIFEYTSGGDVNGHLAKKKILFEKINESQEEFLEYARGAYGKKFQDLLCSKYSDANYKVKIVYASQNQEPGSELVATVEYLTMFGTAAEAYFRELVKAIEKSARFEFYKFLGLQYGDVGEACLTPTQKSFTYTAYLLPDAHSQYPKGTKIVTFYADPNSVIESAYVLRRGGWQESGEAFYQRTLVAKKIKDMRRYLADEERVFINNVIVTLPGGTVINSDKGDGKNLSEKELAKVRSVSLSIPGGYDGIGVIDGQHRVFCYHEGRDEPEKKIQFLRKKQLLLVTGLIFPNGTPEAVRLRYEAQLFLEINDKQKRVQAALKQDIEMLLKPQSSISIAKSIIRKMAKQGIYKNMFSIGYFDGPKKIKTSSIVSYGLNKLVDINGKNSLYSIWNSPEKHLISSKSPLEMESTLDAYIEYCTEVINDFFIFFKSKCSDKGAWKLGSDAPLLSPTAINGLIHVLIALIRRGTPLTQQSYATSFEKLNTFDFEIYKSSHWAKMAEDLMVSHYVSGQK